jgi:hypothetical protein
MKLEDALTEEELKELREYANTTINRFRLLTILGTMGRISKKPRPHLELPQKLMATRIKQIPR